MKQTQATLLGTAAALALVALTGCQTSAERQAKKSEYQPAPIHYWNKSYAWHNSSDHVSEFRRFFY